MSSTWPLKLHYLTTDLVHEYYVYAMYTTI